MAGLGKTLLRIANGFSMHRAAGQRLGQRPGQRPIVLHDHTLYRYLVKELLQYFGILFLFFFAIFFLNEMLLLAESILKKRVPVLDVIKLITYCLPVIIAQSAPFATLVGFLMCIGSMMSSNEILIMRAAGIGYHLILLPVLVLGLLISLLSFFVNDYLLPLGTIRFTQLRRQILMSNPAVELEPFSIKRMNDSVLVIGDVKGTSVSDLVFFNTDTDGTQRIIAAEHSVVEKSEVPGVAMTLKMDDATVGFFKRSKKTDFDVLSSSVVTLNIFDSSIFDTSMGIRPNEMTSYDLHQEIVKMRKNIESSSQKKDLNLYVLEYHKKFSLPFGSLFFALLALPLAILFGRHNGQTIGFIIGLVLCLLYWTMMILGQVFSSRTGSGGMLTMWLPNLVVGTAGVLFYTALVRK